MFTKNIFLLSDLLGGGGGSSPAPGGNQNMKFGGLPYEMHRLGGRNEVSCHPSMYRIKYNLTLSRMASLMLSL